MNTFKYQFIYASARLYWKIILLFFTVFVLVEAVCGVTVSLYPGEEKSAGPYYLEPEESVSVTVQIQDSGDWELISSGVTAPSGNKPEYFLWTGGGSWRSYSFSAVNTSWIEAWTTVRVNATWRKKQAEGEGAGGEEETIDGYVILDARSRPGNFYILAQTNCICIGCNVNLSAYMEKSGGGQKSVVANWTVTGNGEIVGSSQGSSVTVKGTAAGSMTVIGRYYADESFSDSEHIIVVAVESITADPDIVCLGTTPEFTITTSPSGYTNMVSYNFDPDTPGEQTVTATCGTSEASCSVTIIKVEIEPSSTNVCSGVGSVDFDLSADSYTPSGAEWSINPSNSASIDNNGTVTFDATGRTYTITAVSIDLTNCIDTAELNVLKVVSETVATTPADQARTTLGIGEEVVCTITPSMSVTWSVTGGGSNAPSTGASTTFTASKSPSSSTVHATIDNTDCTIEFTVVAPNGITSTLKTNSPFGTIGTNQIGARSVFNCTVLPNDVSFYNAEFQENIPGENYTWPDGTSGNRPSDIVSWTVGYDNKTTDTVSSGLDPIGRIHNGTNYVDFSYTVRVPEEYKNQSGTWVEWLPGETHPREYQGADQKARVKLKASNTAIGGWMGPWQ